MLSKPRHSPTYLHWLRETSSESCWLKLYWMFLLFYYLKINCKTKIYLQEILKQKKSFNQKNVTKVLYIYLKKCWFKNTRCIVYFAPSDWEWRQWKLPRGSIPACLPGTMVLLCRFPGTMWGVWIVAMLLLLWWVGVERYALFIYLIVSNVNNIKSTT